MLELHGGGGSSGGVRRLELEGLYGEEQGSTDGGFRTNKCGVRVGPGSTAVLVLQNGSLWTCSTETVQPFVNQELDKKKLKKNKILEVS